MTIYAISSRGKTKGEAMTPHKHDDGKYVVSKSRFTKDYVRLRSVDEIREYVERGYGVRMSPAHRSGPANLFSALSIKFGPVPR